MHQSDSSSTLATTATGIQFRLFISRCECSISHFLAHVAVSTCADGDAAACAVSGRESSGANACQSKCSLEIGNRLRDIHCAKITIKFSNVKYSFRVARFVWLRRMQTADSSLCGGSNANAKPYFVCTRISCKTSLLMKLNIQSLRSFVRLHFFFSPSSPLRLTGKSHGLS